MRGQEDTTYPEIYAGHGFGPSIRKALAPAKDIDILITEGTTFSRPQVKAQTEAELAEEMIQITKNYNKVLLLCSTTNIDRINVMIRVGNRTNKAIVEDILLANVLSVIPQRIPNPSNAEDIYCFVPSYYYKKRNIDKYKSYIDPFKEKISQTGRILHRRLYNEC